MIVWKDVLQTKVHYIPNQSNFLEALQVFEESQAHLLLVSDQNGVIIGYVDRNALLSQINEKKDLQKQIIYKSDILKVPEISPISFFHNITVFIGIDNVGEIVGFTTTVDARHQLGQYRIQQLNQIFNSSGTGIITTDTDFRITFINETAEQILGISKNVLLYRNYKTLLTIKENLEEVLLGKQLLSVESSINFKQISGNFSQIYKNEKIIGIVHIFSPREQLEEAVKDLEFVRNLNNDLQAIYSSANEQIIVVNNSGNIIRIAGTFLKDFWDDYTSEQLVGKDIHQLEEEGIFNPNIFSICMEKKQKLTMVQESKTGIKIWSVATPVFYKEKIEKIVIFSRDITAINKLQEELELTKRKTKKYKEELDELLRREENVIQKKLIYRSQVMVNLVEELKHISRVDSTVLLIGESGVGKEVFTQVLHEYSLRKKEPFIRVNCGAIPENLIESELFGYEKGAFTGADQKGKPGLFEMAHKGSIFLDEVTELPYDMQVKLLRVLQENELMRIGGTTVKSIDVRVIVATNRNIRELVVQGKFREDLYYRLHVIPIEIPPLRKRKIDILPLCVHFVEKLNAKYKFNKSLTREAIEVLEEYDWPGNVRELQNVIERLVVTTRNEMISDHDVFSCIHDSVKNEGKKKIIIQDIIPLNQAIEEVESQLIRKALEKYGSGAKAAKVLGVSPATVSRRMKKLF